MKAAVLGRGRKNSKRPLRWKRFLSLSPWQDKCFFACERVACAGRTCILWKASFRSVANHWFLDTRSLAKLCRGRRRSCHRDASGRFVDWRRGRKCWYCQHGMENLCDVPTFTGYTVNGGYAEFAVARTDFVFPLPEELDDLHAAPLLCAGIIGFRSLRVAECRQGESVGLYRIWGIGAFGDRSIEGVEVRGVCLDTRRVAPETCGVAWRDVGGKRKGKPPVELDGAVTFAPSGDVVIAALSSLRKGGVVAINAIHLDRIPEFDYDRLLWGERQLRSVANMTRQDARDFLKDCGGN